MPRFEGVLVLLIGLIALIGDASRGGLQMRIKNMLLALSMFATSPKMAQDVADGIAPEAESPTVTMGFSDSA